MPDLTYLKNLLGISVCDSTLLERALIHSSFVNENPHLVSESNERMEFIGDSVLGLIIAEELYHKMPKATEGEMTKIRAEIVRGETLARMARSIRLGEFLYLGKGEEANGGRDKTKNLAGAMEALIAAIFLDQGYTAARKSILSLLEAEISKALNTGIEMNSKSRLQELIQARGEEKLKYLVTSAEGPEHDRLFTVEVSIDGKMLSQGTGKSKKTAEAEAARLALEKLEHHD